MWLKGVLFLVLSDDFNSQIDSRLLGSRGWRGLRQHALPPLFQPFPLVLVEYFLYILWLAGCSHTPIVLFTI